MEDPARDEPERGPRPRRYDALAAVYRFECPERDDTARVPLSAFRHVERLAGPAHPAVFQIAWSCACGAEHQALVKHDELDYAPLDPAADVAFWDPLTGRLGGDLGSELAAAAMLRLRRGVWPWSFWCSAEERMRPGYPSALSWLAEAGRTAPRRRLLGVGVRCATCGETSINVVSHRHLDEPFFHDREVGALSRPVGEMAAIERFRDALWSGAFDTHRTDLAA
jgi:hypothetical protein